MLPNFLIIGAPRAGTTWAAKNMMDHPQIFMPRIKEVHFFDANYEKGMDYYEAFFSDAKDQIAVGEATPEYLYIPEVAARIHQHLPNAKLIVSLRNPVERLYSRYWNSKAKYVSNRDLSFEEKIKQKPLFIGEGFYYDHLTRYYRLYPREQILVLLYDDLEKDPHGFLSEIYKFLGVDPEFTSDYQEIKINSAAAKKYVGKSQLLWNIHRGLMRVRLFSLARMVEDMNRNEYPPMHAETKRWLVEEVYKDKNRQLEELIGRDLTAWNRLD